MITYWMRNISNTDYTNDNGYKSAQQYVLNISSEDTSI